MMLDAVGAATVRERLHLIAFDTAPAPEAARSFGERNAPTQIAAKRQRAGSSGGEVGEHKTQGIVSSRTTENEGILGRRHGEGAYGCNDDTLGKCAIDWRNSRDAHRNRSVLIKVVGLQDVRSI